MDKTLINIEFAINNIIKVFPMEKIMSAIKSGELYSKGFYDALTAGSLKAARHIVPILNLIFPKIKSVVDLGCGSGAFLSVFQKQGCIVKGYDYGIGAPDSLLINRSLFNTANLTEPLDYEEKYDLCISLEVAEHIDESKAPNFILNIVNAADMILFSAARPGQPGLNHINCQWPAYWVEKFSEHHYIAYDILRGIIWNETEIPWWYRQNIMLFIRDYIFSPPPEHTLIDNFANLHCLSLIHPESIKL